APHSTQMVLVAVSVELTVDSLHLVRVLFLANGFSCFFDVLLQFKCIAKWAKLSLFSKEFGYINGKQYFIQRIICEDVFEFPFILANHMFMGFDTHCRIPVVE